MSQFGDDVGCDSDLDDEAETDHYQELTGFVGNHPKSDVPFLEKAIAEYAQRTDRPDNKITIGDHWNGYGAPTDPEKVGVYRDGEHGLDVFWDIFRRIKREAQQ